MTAWSPEREARSNSARAGAYTRRAEKEAREADAAYATASRWKQQAAALTQTPGMWFEGYNPAALEDNARTWAHIGDIWLRASFHSTRMATSYRAMAAVSRARRSAS